LANASAAARMEDVTTFQRSTTTAYKSGVARQ